MCFKYDKFRQLIPRLAQYPSIRAEIVERYDDEADGLLDAIKAGVALDGEVDEELQQVALNAFQSEACTVLALSWDGTAPGGGGAVWISEFAGIYVVTSSDYSPEGPFDSLLDALSCECFYVATLEPQVSSDVLPEAELLDIAQGVADSENGGSVWVNGVEYIAEGDDLRRQGDEEHAS